VVIGCVHADRRTVFAAPDAAAMAHVRDVVQAIERAVAARRTGVVAAPVIGPQAKVDAVLRVLRGEPAADVARALTVDDATLEGWRTDFLAGAAARLAG
jgi:hypothetical protein